MGERGLNRRRGTERGGRERREESQEIKVLGLFGWSGNGLIDDSMFSPQSSHLSLLKLCPPAQPAPPRD